MKNKVRFSVYSKIVTAATLILCIVIVVTLIHEHEREQYIVASIIIGLAIIFGLYYCPVSVMADQYGVTLHRFLSRPKVFRYEEIASAETCYPSAGGLRLCGSGGFFGYWGYFSDIMIGTYFGYYGARDSCFLIRLKNGRQYVIGCENMVEMVRYVSSHI